MDEKNREDSLIELAQTTYGTSNGMSSKAKEAEQELHVGPGPGDIDIETSNEIIQGTDLELSSNGVSSESESEDGKGKKRETWDNKFQFILSLIGYAVGLGNVWRFSYLCAKNGGSAFLFPYLLMLVLLGIPLFYLELTLGQGTRKGPVGAWKKITPNLLGVGIAASIVNSYICLYYNVIIAWVIYYFFNSFTANLPWGNCFGHRLLGLNQTEKIELLRNNTGLAWSSCFNSSSEYYWYNSALEASDSIAVAGVFNWRLLLCLMAAWAIIYLCLFKGIQSAGKIIYFTAIFPYVVLLCLFFRAVTLEGAGEGLKFLFLPAEGWSKKLFDPVVWLDAATQIFFSLGLSIGALIALSSYNKPRNNALVDSVLVCLTNSGTSIFASIIVFSVVGFRAVQLDIPVSLVSEGPGLAFVIFSEALLRMPGAPFWALLFFVMLFTLGLDSQFATMEGVLTVLRDMKTFKKIRKELLVAILCFVFFIVSIPFILGNGVYLFALFDQFAGSVPLLLIGFFEFIAVGWVFGVKRYFNTYATAYHPSMIYLWTIMWKFVGPLIMLIIFFASVLREIIDPLTYTVYRDYREEREQFPEWALFVGSLIILTSVSFIPLVLIGRLIALEEARTQALEFFRELKQDTVNLFLTIKLFCLKKRGRWSPSNEEDDTAVLNYHGLHTPPPPEIEQEVPTFSTTHIDSDLKQ